MLQHAKLDFLESRGGVAPIHVRVRAVQYTRLAACGRSVSDKQLPVRAFRSLAKTEWSMDWYQIGAARQKREGKMAWQGAFVASTMRQMLNTRSKQVLIRLNLNPA